MTAAGAVVTPRRELRRRGGTRLGCVFALVLLGAAVYYGASFVQMYTRYYQFQDAFKQQAKFADKHSDADIKNELRATADSLQLPPEAQSIYVKRKGGRIVIWNEYYYHIELPFFARDFYFNPHAAGDI